MEIIYTALMGSGELRDPLKEMPIELLSLVAQLISKLDGLYF
jgi:hypothetical protein